MNMTPRNGKEVGAPQKAPTPTAESLPVISTDDSSDVDMWMRPIRQALLAGRLADLSAHQLCVLVSIVRTTISELEKLTRLGQKVVRRILGELSKAGYITIATSATGLSIRLTRAVGVSDD
jgi:hypothetical protein